MSIPNKKRERMMQDPVTRRNFLSASAAGAAAGFAALADPGTAAAQAVDVKKGDLPNLIVKQVKVYVTDTDNIHRLNGTETGEIVTVVIESGIEGNYTIGNREKTTGWLERAKATLVGKKAMRSTGLNMRGPSGYAMDSITVSFHGNSTTHFEALSHFIYEGHIYNGFPASSVTAWGAEKNDVMPYKDGLGTRGVLIDWPRFKGVPYMGDDEAIYAEDLDASEKKTGARIESGDCVLLRTGRWKRVAEKGPLNLNVAAPGLYASCAKWLKERKVALLGSDAVQDILPRAWRESISPFISCCWLRWGRRCLIIAIWRRRASRRRNCAGALSV